LGRNATINFNKKGNLSAVTDSLYLFANASIQGSANVFKTMLTTKRGRYLAGGIVMLGVLQSFLNNMASDCEHDPENCYDNIPNYEKDRYMIIKVPGGKGFIKIPLAYGFNVFYNMGEKAAQLMQGKQSWQSASTQTMASMLNAFNPVGGTDTPVLQQVSPTVTDPVVQWFTNQDAMGRKIYPDNQYLRSPDSERAFPSDSPTAKAFSKWLNQESGGNDKVKGKIDVSPGTFDWIYQTATGGMGQFIKQVVTTSEPVVSAAVNMDADKLKGYDDIDMKNIPLVNRFYTVPHEKADKGELFDIKDRSYNEILPKQDLENFDKEVEKAVRLKQLDAEKAKAYKNTVNKNQFELTNQPLIDRIDKSKTEILEPEELSEIIQTLEELAQDEKIPQNWLKGYKAEITGNQNKLKKKNEEE
jgi:hypothetical protein